MILVAFLALVMYVPPALVSLCWLDMLLLLFLLGPCLHSPCHVGFVPLVLVLLACTALHGECERLLSFDCVSYALAEHTS